MTPKRSSPFHSLRSPRLVFAGALTATLAVTAQILVPGGKAIPEAHAIPSFNARELEGAIREFYDLYGTQGADLTEADKLEYADSVAEMVSILDPTPFNDVVGHMAADYGSNPAHRPAIELILTRLHSAVLPQLRAQAEHSAVMTVLDDVFKAWTVAYAFGFGKGLWRSRGSGLQGIERFRHVVTTVSANLPRTTRQHLMAAGIGAGAGIGHAIYLHLQTKKLDPSQILRDAQSSVVQRLATQTADARAELSRYAGLPEIASTQRETVRALLQRLDPQLRSAQDELSHLYDTAPHLRPQMSPIADDLRAARGMLGRVSLKLDGDELSEDFGGGWMP
jgi:hypothetical protein